LIAEKEVVIEYCPTEEQITNIFTKLVEDRFILQVEDDAWNDKFESLI
jgi:hypothetical protein